MEKNDLMPVGDKPEIIALVHTHGDPDTTMDTVASVRAYLTDKVLAVVDGVGYDTFQAAKPQVPLLRGFRHGCPRAPFRNVVLGLLTAARHWPEADWYVHLEYDCLLGSSDLLPVLAQADREGVWLLGADLREAQPVSLDLVERIVRTRLPSPCYLLGACLFYSKHFIRRAVEEDFFERFLYYTNDLCNGFFPGYAGYDIIEHMMPTLARHWGGEVGQLSRWCQFNRQWVAGDCRRFPIRWRPELTVADPYQTAAVMHPLKTYNNPIRAYHRAIRARLP